jgi:hypothetical protein
LSVGRVLTFEIVPAKRYAIGNQEQVPVINVVLNFPALQSYSQGDFELATLLCERIVPKELELAWACFDASNCPHKAVRNGCSQGAINLRSIYV